MIKNTTFRYPQNAVITFHSLFIDAGDLVHTFETVDVVAGDSLTLEPKGDVALVTASSESTLRGIMYDYSSGVPVDVVVVFKDDIDPLVLPTSSLSNKFVLSGHGLVITYVKVPGWDPHPDVVINIPVFIDETRNKTHLMLLLTRTWKPAHLTWQNYRYGLSVKPVETITRVRVEDRTRERTLVTVCNEDGPVKGPCDPYIWYIDELGSPNQPSSVVFEVADGAAMKRLATWMEDQYPGALAVTKRDRVPEAETDDELFDRLKTETRRTTRTVANSVTRNRMLRWSVI